MSRILLSGLLLLAAAGEASAQAAPARTATSTRRPVSKAPRPATRKAPVKQAAAPKAAAVRPARAATPESGTISTTANVYAAPGMPVNVQSGKADSYDGKKPTQPARTTNGNTLTPR